MSSKPTLYLIDGSSQMYRAYHAPIRTAEGTLLRNAHGIPTNAVYIFVTMLKKLLKEHAPQFIVAAFDLPGRTFRDDLSADYKANRKPMPDDLASQIPLVHDACTAMGVPILTQERYEADDVIGTLTERGSRDGYDIVIVTGDKDFFQLVGDGVRIFNPRDDGTWYDANGVLEKFGVRPDQVVDTLALMGDSVDNVKGVPGIGEKGARELLSTYDSLDNLLEHAADVPQKKYREALINHRADAISSRELLRIHTDVPIPFDIESFRYRGPSRERCYQIFSDLGFRSLTMEFAPTAETIDKNYHLVTTDAELDALVEEIASAGRIALRVLPDGAQAVRAGIAGLAVATDARRARYIPLRHTGMHSGPQLAPAATLARLKPLLENAAIAKVAHDVKPDLLMLERHGISMAGITIDTMLASYLLDSAQSGHPLERISLEHLGYKALTEEDVCGKGAKAIPLVDLPPDAVLDYACERADLALQLASPLDRALDDAALSGVYDEIEQPLIPVLAAIERAGVRVNTNALGVLSQRLDVELSERSTRIFELAGEPFNIGSPQQLSRILFDKLQLPALKRNAKTRTASTAVDVLEELAQSHELPRLILDWRALQKLKGTYVDALPQLVNPETGRVHTSFNQAVAATGRLSSSDPNLQNIPIRTELGREIRRAFIAEPGHVLISADYSQIEFRVLAHLADEPVLIDAFREGADFHERTALKIFGTDSGRDAHDLRSTAKMVNYALLYGKTAFTLAKDINVTPQQAQEFIDAYFAGFPRVRAFIDETLDGARATGVVKTLFGRRRLVPELNSANGQIRAATERIAVNLPIQGTAADIMKKAMIDVHQGLSSHPGTRMILTVHDELLFEVPDAHADAVAAWVRETMQNAVVLKVPLTVDVGIGQNWKDAKH
ncbi:MAG: DNA polymerase I [Acidobacteriaceae bacterium]|jgi:DNA polymerase-1|nr:DNA polymerase I [Acidobacteriaceae bacterium]